MIALFRKILATAFLIVAAVPSTAQEKVLNLYSSRHYQTDEALYSNFTRKTGIRLHRIDAPEDALIERLRNEGAASPADVLVTVDAGRLWRAEQLGLLQPVRSHTLEARIPAQLRHPAGLWFGFSTRARVIVYNRQAIPQGAVRDYQDLADPKWKGKVCMRSSSSIYNLSLMSALIAHHGEQRAESWARGVVANFARAPKGGDTDQIRAVAAGECALTLANTYYYARLVKSQKPDERDAAARTGVVFPNQQERGTHLNISGAGVLKNAPHRDSALKFLEYLAGDEAQRHFSDGNNEFPAVAEVRTANTALAALGAFKADELNVSALGSNQPAAQRVYDRAGWR
jgi:iron(III) transport system substrate-binding protein